MTIPDLTLEHRRAVVTGAGQGVGFAIAAGLARAGAEVWVNDLDEGRAKSAADEIAEAGGKAEAVVADVTDHDAVAAMVERTGRVDIVVNNAGIPPGLVPMTPFAQTAPDEWEPWIRLNLEAVLRVTHAYLPGLIEGGWGRVLTIVSDAGRRGEPGQVVYGAAKAAAMGFTRGLAVEVGARGVTANCIALGAIRHGAVAAFLDGQPEHEQKLVKRYPAGRLGLPEDPAPLAVLLCSEAGSWITGQVYPVDGGFSPAL